MRFPEREAKVVALAVQVANGMALAPQDFPNPPVAPAEILTIHERYQKLLGKVHAAEAALRELHAEKDRAYSALKEATKANLRFGEIKARGQTHILTGLGWGPPRERKRLQAPGEVRDIKVGAQGQTTLDLSWSPPVDGGKVAAYEVLRREAKGGKWETIATVATLAVHLENQPRLVELDYQVVAMNRAGRGGGSGVVSVVL